MHEALLMEQVLEWLAKGERGISSETMAFRMLGKQRGGDGFREYHPLDPDDLRRCLLFLAAAPTARLHLDKLRPVSKAWDAMVDRWDEMEESFLAETGNTLYPPRGTHCPKTYKLMQDIQRVPEGERAPGLYIKC